MVAKLALPHLSVGLLLGFAFTGCGGAPASTEAPPPPKVEVGHPTARELVDEDDYNGWL
jgi:hypothetical protein